MCSVATAVSLTLSLSLLLLLLLLHSQVVFRLTYRNNRFVNYRINLVRGNARFSRTTRQIQRSTCQSSRVTHSIRRISIVHQNLFRKARIGNDPSGGVGWSHNVGRHRLSWALWKGHNGSSSCHGDIASCLRNGGLFVERIRIRTRRVRRSATGTGTGTGPGCERPPRRASQCGTS
jgi:hypothetical protein